MNIVIASDHAGISLKNELRDYLSSLGHIVHDEGTHTLDSVDYPDYAKAAVKKLLSGEVERGIIICGTGIGISIAANRYKGIRATLCYDIFAAKMARMHNNSNMLALGANMTALSLAREIVNTWLATEYEGGRHDKRIEKLDID